MNAEAVFGVVVIGRNEGARLQRCLHSLAAAACPVVYVDSGSTDGSVAFARAQGAQVVELDPARPFSMARARNAGFACLRATHPQIPFVQFLDGDCEMDADWPARARAHFQAVPSAVAVAGLRRELRPSASIYNRLCDIEWNAAVGEVAAVGGDAMLRAEAFAAAGGFNEALIAGEEPDLCLRLREAGGRIDRLDVPMTRHDAAITSFRQWWRRMRRGGYGGADVAARYRAAPAARDVPFRFMTRSARTWTVGWGGLTLVLALLAGLLAGGLVAGIVLAAGLAVWLAQALRIACGVRRRAADGPTALAYGLLTMIGKWAQLAGQWQYHCDQRAARTARLIEYKGPPS